jgi:hypothetical protein
MLRRLFGVLEHFSFGLKKDGTIFCATVGFTVVVHAVRRLEGVRASVMTTASAWCPTSLDVLILLIVEGSLASFLWGRSKILLPILWWPTTIEVNAIYLLGIATLIVTVARWP